MQATAPANSLFGLSSNVKAAAELAAVGMGRSFKKIRPIRLQLHRSMSVTD